MSSWKCLLLLPTIFFTSTPLAARAGDTAAKVADYEAMARTARELLTEMVAANPSNPPGNEARVVKIGARLLKEAGIDYEITEFAPGRQNLVARLPANQMRGNGTLGPILLLAHIDVVGTEGQAWTVPPHQVTEKDGYLYGRGVADDLGMAAINLLTLVKLKVSGQTLARDVIVAWTGDEESGGAGIQFLLKHRPSSIAADFAMNEGGGILLGPDGKPQLVSLQAAEKIYQDFELVAHGTTGHSSAPTPDNAIARLGRALARLAEQRFPPRLLPVTRAYYQGRLQTEKAEMAAAMRSLVASKGLIPQRALALLDQDPVHAANLRTTCVATLVSGGTRANALPAEARAVVNCRILPDEEPAAVRKRLEALIDDPQIEIKPVREAHFAKASPLAGPAVEGIRRAVTHLWPGLPILPYMSRGATDAVHLRGTGIPTYGLNPMPGTEADGRRAHGIDERIPVPSLRTGVEFMHTLVLEVAGQK